MNWHTAAKLFQTMKNKPKFLNKAKQMILWKKNVCVMEMIASKNSTLIVKSTQTFDKQAPKRRIN